jgi:hypothetical protein
MRGGYLRFQAQYLRRIRLPEWRHVSPALRATLTDAGRSQDHSACNEAVGQLYGLDHAEKALLFAMEDAA